VLESADRTVVARATVEVTPPQTHADAVVRVLADIDLKTIAAVGHRIVHGGDLASAVRVTPAVRARIAGLADLAPLHNPPGLATLAAAEAALPDVPHVATFDTAFHATLPPVAYTYPLPRAWMTDWGIRRYGFHGLSHSYCATRAPAVLGHPVERLVICHLGHGCSATAVLRGRSIDTTMGFTPLDGLMMATRSGAVDPGILTHLQIHHALSAQTIDDALNHQAGLLGVSGVSADMREVLAASRAGNQRATLAIDVYTHRVRQAIGALAVTLGGIDALVFTAGVGENAPEIREAVCRGLECLGVALDPRANASCRPDAEVAMYGSQVRILVLATREDLAMLSDVVRVMGANHGDLGPKSL
jgi:acetate kinase